MLQDILIVAHLIVTILMIAIILLQKSEGGALGMGGGGGQGMVSARGSTNFLTRLTTILAIFFFGACLVMNSLNRQDEDFLIDLLEATPAGEQSAPPSPLAQ